MSGRLDATEVAERLGAWDRRAAPAAAAARMRELATWLLLEVDLVIAGAPARMLAVEGYLWAPWHPDPFAHQSMPQAAANTWYMHRTGLGYCGGSYKGVDLTFGSSDVFGGLLIRAIELPNGRIVDGPSLIMDRVLAATETRRPFELDTRLMPRLATDPGSPLHLAPTAERRNDPVLATARVGLTLRRAASHPSMLTWWLRPLRFTTAASRLRKATVHEAAALMLAPPQALDDAAIARAVGTRCHVVSRWRAALEAGRREDALEQFVGHAPSGARLARAHGCWWARYRGDGAQMGAG